MYAAQRMWVAAALPYTGREVAMCRYALSIDKTRSARFTCREAFKTTGRRANGSIRACPQCGKTMTVMGHDFRAPAQKDIRQWRKVEWLAAHGLVFASCGCGGPGYAPRTLGDARRRVEELPYVPEGVRLRRRWEERHPR